MRLAVFLPNWIGDVVMATPALRALKKMVGEQGDLIGVMRPYVSEVLAGSPWLDEEILYSPKVKSGDRRQSGAIAKLRAARVDMAVLLTNSLRTGWMAWRSGAAKRVGTARDLRRLLMNVRVDTGAAATIDAYLKVAYAAGCGIESPHLELGTTSEDETAADAVWKALDLPNDNRVVVMNSGGAYGAAKHWPAEHFAAVARRLAHEENLHVLVNCGPAERDIARAIVRRADDRRVVSLAEFDVPLGLTKACIRRSRLLLTTDSGPRFFGIAFGKPVISLFGPTSPEHTQTHYNLETSLTLALDCQPCVKRTCPLGHHACMRDLSVGQVYGEVIHGLRRSQSAAA
ncbi:lipopolysaccharide heptosyltransferase II [Aeoliella sp. ICT_H6.2]|uniref:lipopolysaccharide heptosyltransferase II n=1 Tax=Aeoliella straminimaris TaxID=2954799 RepID=A0A9X2JI91_9BACT|nr:lipopolysaccharide heptosyltransferase II [Aeoliella straminimaris]MCO6045448.1 lipopolysaccharide heptosyltransferase II [Aeoliella straminimaris]